jgi:hypothetical protein
MDSVRWPTTSANGAQSLADAKNSRVLIVRGDVEVAELEPPDGYEPPFCDPDEREDLVVTDTGWGLPDPNSVQVQALIAPATDYSEDELGSAERVQAEHLLFGFPEPWQGDPLAVVAEINSPDRSRRTQFHQRLVRLAVRLSTYGASALACTTEPECATSNQPCTDPGART